MQQRCIGKHRRVENEDTKKQVENFSVNVIEASILWRFLPVEKMRTIAINRGANLREENWRETDTER